jgi:hypothetical protein
LPGGLPTGEYVVDAPHAATVRATATSRANFVVNLFM